ncbi:hypothetical protein PYCCODRAFT_235047 [Trametes coccinea BRFM310]|uniref:Uncharacterized protein n=1 Tax=Trametes coccinea (strain BRFM310) TaxID=1353009 RepID=A0A1Y2IR25_TRAC3|nr:hypothetical protein PYCCODRAFT_235047 [Trametes coccinea BRFM310]
MRKVRVSEACKGSEPAIRSRCLAFCVDRRLTARGVFCSKTLACESEGKAAGVDQRGLVAVGAQGGRQGDGTRGYTAIAVEAAPRTRECGKATREQVRQTERDSGSCTSGERRRLPRTYCIPRERSSRNFPTALFSSHLACVYILSLARFIRASPSPSEPLILHLPPSLSSCSCEPR